MLTIPNPMDASDPVVVHLAEEFIDDATKQQIKSMCGHPAVYHARVMPDCHKGSGTCVGFTCCLTGTMSPGLIGGDIGCGVSAHPLPAALMNKRNGSSKVKRAIHSQVPMGNGFQNIHEQPIISEEQFDAFYEECTSLAKEFATAYDEKFASLASFRPMLPLVPLYSREWVKERCEILGLHYKKDYLCCMGTLGGGNHFIEADGTEDGTDFLLVVHSGSRALGQGVYRYWSQFSKKNAAAQSSSNATQQATPGLLENDDFESEDFDKNCYLSGEHAHSYFLDMIWAQKYAEMNRLAMLSAVIGELSLTFTPSAVIQSVHNYIDFRDLVVRKGAIRAHNGEKCIVALNMRDGILVGDGKGNDEWNRSSAHGCGRVIPRGVASKNKGSKKDTEAALRRFRAEMEGVDCDTITVETLDERPSAYRQPDLVINALCDTMDIPGATKYRTLVCAKGLK